MADRKLFANVAYSYSGSGVSSSDYYYGSGLFLVTEHRGICRSAL